MINEVDQYFWLVDNLGMYDPLARAVIRLMKESLAKMNCLPEQAMAPEFAALPLADRLKVVMASTLNEWNKMNEMVVAMRSVTGIDQLDMVADLLFEQWRQFFEASGVDKPRWQLYGPRRPDPGVDVPRIAEAPRET